MIDQEKENHSIDLTTTGRRRPFSVTVFSALVLILSVYSFVRFYLALDQWDFLSQLSGFFPAYVGLSGLVWGFVNLGVFWFIIHVKRYSRWLIFFWLFAFSVYFWVDRLLISANRVKMESWSFAILVNILLFLLVFFFLTRPKVKRYFEGNDER